MQTATFTPNQLIETLLESDDAQEMAGLSEGKHYALFSMEVVFWNIFIAFLINIGATVTLDSIRGFLSKDQLGPNEIEEIRKAIGAEPLKLEVSEITKALDALVKEKKINEKQKDLFLSQLLSASILN